MSAPIVDPRSRVTASLAAALLVVAVFLFSHSYTGVRHDGSLYLGDALARLLPGQFHDDLYFLFGSQGRFTLLPAFYAALIQAFGVGGGTMAGLLLAFALYLSAAWYLVAGFTTRLRAIVLLSVVLGWTIYGGLRIFAYSESFLTARSFAEPLVLAALGLLIRGRTIPALATLAVGLLVHPLIAAGGWLAAGIWLLGADRRWWWAVLAGVLATLALGAWGGGPFADFFTRYDATWLALVQEANGHAFVLRWNAHDFGLVAFELIVLWFVATRLDNPILRRLAIAVAIAGVVAIGASLVLVDLLGSSFFGKLQIWRAQWILQWVAMASLPLVVEVLWREDGPHGRVAAILLAIAWVAPYTAAPAVLAAMALAIDALRTRFVLSRPTFLVVAAGGVVAAVTVVVQYEMRVVKLGTLLDQPMRLMLGQALAMNVALMAVALALLLFAPRAIGTLAIAVAMCVGAVAVWDQRSDWPKRLESYPVGTHVWKGLIEPDAKVYWYRDLIAPWLLLGHANYYTQQQGSGAVFSRDMVVELDKRRKVTGLLDFQEQLCRMMNGLNEKPGSCEPDVEAMRAVCSDGGIDYAVLQSRLDGARPVASLSTGVVENGYEKTFYLYRCAALSPAS